MKIHKGDTVLIISGKDKGRKGKIIEALPKEAKVIIENINLRKKHIKPKRSGEKGQIIELPGPLSVSDVKIVCPRCGKAARVGYKLEGKKKFRICKKCNQEI